MGATNVGAVLPSPAHPAVAPAHVVTTPPQAMLRLHDRDGSGNISFEEFEKLHVWLSGVSSSFQQHDAARRGAWGGRGDRCAASLLAAAGCRCRLLACLVCDGVQLRAPALASQPLGVFAALRCAAGGLDRAAAGKAVADAGYRLDPPAFAALFASFDPDKARRGLGWVPPAAAVIWRPAHKLLYRPRSAAHAPAAAAGARPPPRLLLTRCNVCLHTCRTARCALRNTWPCVSSCRWVGGGGAAGWQGAQAVQRGTSCPGRACLSCRAAH